MHDRQTAAFAAVLSSILLVGLLFAYAVFRAAEWGTAFALLTAFLVYVYQTQQYAEIVRIEQLRTRYTLPPYLTGLHILSLISGLVASLLASIGV